MTQNCKKLAICLVLSLALSAGAGLAAGNGNGNGGGKESGGMGGRSVEHASEGTDKAKNTLGPLNAAHASATAFAHANPNSRVGRIAAYKEAAALAAETDADALSATFTQLIAASSSPGLAEAYADWQAGSMTQADFETLLSASTDEAVKAAYADWQQAAAADATAESQLQQLADGREVTPEMKAQLEALLAGK